MILATDQRWIFIAIRMICGDSSSLSFHFDVRYFQRKSEKHVAGLTNKFVYHILPSFWFMFIIV